MLVNASCPRAPTTPNPSSMAPSSTTSTPLCTVSTQAFRGGAQEEVGLGEHSSERLEWLLLRLTALSLATI